MMLFIIQQHYNQWPGDPRYILFSWQHGLLMSSWYEMCLSGSHPQWTRLQWIWWVWSV